VAVQKCHQSVPTEDVLVTLLQDILSVGWSVQLIGKDTEGSNHSLIWGCPDIFWDGLTETTTSVSQDGIRCPCWDSNWSHPPPPYKWEYHLSQYGGREDWKWIKERCWCVVYSV
jgi:hypothetical protein